MPELSGVDRASAQVLAGVSVDVYRERLHLEPPSNGEWVRVELYRHGEPLGWGTAGPGQVEASLLSYDDGDRLPVLPGDLLTLDASDGEHREILVPPLYVQVDPDGLVGGTTLPQVEVHLQLTGRSAPGPITTTVTSSSDGHFSFWAPSDLQRVKATVGSESDQFSSEAERITVKATLRDSAITGSGALGASVFASKAGAPTNTLTILGSTRWCIPVGSRVAPGDTVSVTLTSPDASSTQVQGSVLDIALNAAVAQATISVQAAAGTRLTLNADWPDGSTDEYTGTVSTAGRWESPQLSPGPLPPGFGARVTGRMGPSILETAESLTIADLEVDVGGSLIQGRADASRRITMTLYTREGVQLGRAVRVANRDGRFEAIIQGPGGERVPLEPDQRLEVDTSRGDPILTWIPNLTASSDPDRDTVSGTAPPGRAVDLAVSTGLTLTTTADTLGNYVFDMDGIVDIEPPMGGVVSWRDDRGTKFGTHWAPLRLYVGLDDEYVEGRVEFIGPSSSHAAGTLASGGEVIGRGSAWVSESTGLDGTVFGIEVVDPAGQPVTPDPMDTVSLQVGQETASIVVPDLDALYRANQDAVEGWTTPGSSVTLTGFDASKTTISLSTTAGPDGRFWFALDDAWILSAGAELRARVLVGRHQVWRLISLPIAALDLMADSVLGMTLPHSPVTVELRTNRAAVTRVGSADEMGQFEVLLGQELQPGDVVLTQTALRDWTMPVPAIDLTPDIDGNTVGGRAEPGTMKLVVRSLFPRGNGFVSGEEFEGTPLVTIAADGRLSASMTLPSGKALRVGAGQEYRYVFRPLGEPYAVLGHVVTPLVSVDPRGGEVCLVANEDAEFALSAQVDGLPDQPLLGRTAADGWWIGSVATSGGPESRPLRISGAVDGHDIDEVVPTLPITVSWNENDVWVGASPLQMNVSARPYGCGPWRTFIEHHRADEYPQVSRLSAPSVPQRFYFDFSRPGTGGEVYAISGFVRAFAPFAVTKARVWLHSSRISGTGSPRSVIAASLREGFEVVGGAEVTVDPHGVWDTTVSGPEGSVSLQPGQVLAIRSESGEWPLKLPSLNFDYSAATGVIGHTSPDTPVRLELEITGRDGLIVVPLVSDGTGLVALSPDEISARWTWSLSEARSISAVVDDPSGHEVAVRLVNDAPLSAVYLPLVSTAVDVGR